MRRFSPLAEDVGVLKRELRWHQASTLSGAMGFKSSDEAAGSLDFLDDLARDRDLLSGLFYKYHFVGVVCIGLPN